ncbi:MAG: hypothetical protein ABI967_10685 [bacterium]
MSATANDTMGAKWETAERLARTLSIVAIPVVLAIGGWIIQQRIQNQAVSRDYVQLAVSILKEPESAKVDPDMRAWAVQLLNDNSPTRFTPKFTEQLKTGQVQLPQSFNVSSSPASAQTTTAGETRDDASSWEAKGFNFLLSKDAQAALDAFAHAEKLWPAYHSVSEIKKLLQENQAALSAAPREGKSEVWSSFYRTLVNKYSWGMPADIKDKLNQQI